MTDTINKAARLAYLVLLLRDRHPGRPKKRLDTKALATLLGTTQRSIQRDLHDVERVRVLLEQGLTKQY